MKGSLQKTPQEVSAVEKVRLIQAVAHYCEVSPTGSNITTGQIHGEQPQNFSVRPRKEKPPEQPPTSSPLGNHRTPQPPDTWQLKRRWTTSWPLYGEGKKGAR
ncbi:uncharacterized protein LOC119562719 isoform X2 [Drosophila subpulchrella]|uniref:uncharacterized protein LOC119562719 isoform X2 n=1 Tax=Drosophila subpulchrella TaxID=1486046 RepID=UPI0018A1A91D|nr:uncharacterized protein LOC119562719 isoform X2 [Drosophila subpulchrella]